MEHELKKQIEIKDNLLRLKDEQVKTLENSLNLKDDQIKTLENSLDIKDKKAETLEKTIKLKEEEILKLNSVSIDKGVLNEYNEKIQKLEKEVEILNGELSKADEELESLELENEKLRNAQSSAMDIKIVDFTHANISKSEILEKMREILPNANASVMIVTPKLEDLQELYLYEVKASVSMRIACSINPGIEEHSELLEEFESLDNISLKNYNMEDKYVLVRDGEELLYGISEKSENNNLVIHTKDPNHIKLLNALSLEAWLRSRKV
jgi:DNA repair exonuclease SbcCD ATPase subunit